MKVLLVNSAAPRRWGGAEVWMAQALCVLESMGHEVLALAGPGIPPLAGIPTGDWRGGGPQLEHTLREFRPEVSVAFQHRDLRALWWHRRLAGRRVISRHLDLGKGSWKRRIYYRHIAHQVWVPSEFLGGELVRLDGAPPERVYCIPPSIQRRDRDHAPGEGAPLLCVGRLSNEKGQDTLLHALELLKADVRLSLVGDGPRASEWRELAARLGVSGRVEWISYAPDLPSLRRGCRVLVQPSRRESFGLAVLEAMAQGVPVVASAVGGLREVVGDAGLLVPAKDPAALARAIARLLEHPGEAQALGLSGQARTREHFSPEREAAAFRVALEGVKPDA